MVKFVFIFIFFCTANDNQNSVKQIASNSKFLGLISMQILNYGKREWAFKLYNEKENYSSGVVQL